MKELGVTGLAHLTCVSSAKEEVHKVQQVCLVQILRKDWQNFQTGISDLKH